MAASCLRICSPVLKSNNTSAVWQLSRVLVTVRTGSPTVGPGLLASQGTRQYGSAFGDKPASDLWDSVTTVSNQGRKRGRAKNVMRKMNYNFGQYIGQSRSGLQMPGFSMRIDLKEIGLRGKMPTISKGPSRASEIKDLISEKSTQLKRKGRNPPPLERGFTSRGLPGTSIGPPANVGDYAFEGFDTRILEYKIVSNTTSHQGNKKSVSAFVVTGNRNGLAGYGLAKAPIGMAAIRKAQQKAAKHLMFIERYEDHTVYHNIREHYHRTQVMVEKRQKGHGLVCHRAIKLIAELMGIKDMYAKVEGRTKNYQAITKAFFNAVRSQETHKELAERMQLHVVEYRPECDYNPRVVGSPAGPTRKKEGSEDLEFENLYFGGKVPYRPPPRKPFYHGSDSHRRKELEKYKHRNQAKAKLNRIVVHGSDMMGQY